MVRERKNPAPYIVKYLKYSVVKNYRQSNTLKFIIPGYKVGDSILGNSLGIGNR